MTVIYQTAEDGFADTIKPRIKKSEGGDRGGMVVATGTPEELAGSPNSYTGQFLKEHCIWSDFNHNQKYI